MAKYTVDDKLLAVKRYLDGVESYISIGRSMGTPESVHPSVYLYYNWNFPLIIFATSSALKFVLFILI